MEEQMVEVPFPQVFEEIHHSEERVVDVLMPQLVEERISQSMQGHLADFGGAVRLAPAEHDEKDVDESGQQYVVEFVNGTPQCAELSRDTRAILLVCPKFICFRVLMNAVTVCFFFYNRYDLIHVSRHLA